MLFAKNLRYLLHFKTLTMRLFMPIVFVVLFIFYVLYLGLVKKNLKDQIATVLFPGLFFILVWGILYYELLS